MNDSRSTLLDRFCLARGRSPGTDGAERDRPAGRGRAAPAVTASPRRLPLVLMVVALALPVTRPAFATGPASCPGEAVAAGTGGVDDSDDPALAAYEAGRWEEAFRRHADRADAGDAASARIALLMWRHGRALYRQPFEATPSQRAAWLAVVTEQRHVALACETHRTAQASR
jgi:hypothetical protein